MRWSVLAILLTVLYTPSPAIEGIDLGGGPPEIPVKLLASHDGAVAGGHFQLAVVYEVPPDHHIQLNDFFYAVPMEGEPITLGEPTLPPTKMWDEDPVLLGNVVVRYDVVVESGTPLGERELKFLVGYQACSEQPIYACYAPEEKEISLSLAIVADGTEIKPLNRRLFQSARPPEEGKAPPGVDPDQGKAGPSATDGWLEEAELGTQEGLAAKLRGALARGSWIAFLIVFFAGFLTSFTPCVYPMIPITIGFVAGASRGKLSGFILSLFFVLGIAIVYSSLGVAAALGGGVFGAALQSTTATVFIAAVFTLMGVSMLGAFDLTLPSSLQTKLQTGRRGGVIGAILMGGVTGLVASPCVGPVLVVLLTWVAQVGRVLYGFSLLFVFAVGLGLLFLVLGTFVGAVKTLPKAGQWMEDVKHYFGWIFLFLAVFFLRTKIGETTTAIAYGVFLILLATQIGAFTALTPEIGRRGRWSKGIGTVLLILGIVMMVDGLATRYGWKEAGVRTIAEGGAGAAAGLVWRSDEEAALADALAEGKPVLIDFTAEWCAACHELDEETWVEPRVVAELRRYVTLRLDMTDRTPVTQAMGERWKVSGLPTVIVLDRNGNEVDRFFGFREADQVLPLLKRAT